MTHRLFAYGSLQPGRPNAHVLTPLGGIWQPGTVKGFLKQAGWGSQLGFPGLLLDPAGQAVSGSVLTAEDLNNFWATLDEFEGEQYERVLTAVTLQDGSVVEAYIYVLRGS
jgi:gamma-glutamylcyclotransferase (GGCT)/AIG2-like uncharacterized protein YtfP